MSDALRKCRLCGVTDEGVQPDWIRFRGKDESLQHAAADRCQDRNACHRRVEEAGRKWAAIDSPAVLS